jgi:hypothetical protein
MKGKPSSPFGKGLCALKNMPNTEKVKNGYTNPHSVPHQEYWEKSKKNVKPQKTQSEKVDNKQAATECWLSAQKPLTLPTIKRVIEEAILPKEHSPPQTKEQRLSLIPELVSRP